MADPAGASAEGVSPEVVAAVDKTDTDIAFASHLVDKLAADAAAGQDVAVLAADLGQLSGQLDQAKKDSKKAKSIVDVSSSKGSGSVTGQTFGQKHISWTNAGFAMGIDFLYFLVLLLVMHGFLSWTGRKFSG